MQCPNCGRITGLADKVCPDCGSQLSVNDLESRIAEFEYTKALAAFIEPATSEDIEKENLQNPSLDHHDKNIFIRVWQRNWFVLDVMLMTFPLWNSGNTGITRTGDLVEIIYVPPKDYMLNNEGFIGRIIWYSAKMADRIARHADIKRLAIWAYGILEIDENNQQRVWKGLSLSIKIDSPDLYKEGSISNLASKHPEQYLKINSARWVRQDQVPFWS
jgi:hypothetical protein